ncbi:MAG: ribosomal-protein-alanine N-acetyltransferase [Candidatus Methylomirabilota bacterium]|nr:ribosomal protein S18-alanine N-acetyltransferase [Candidatus Methylomirabilis sp.]NJD68566.1 ribosomal-protein-alanine N-acetyltransferase [candidate division NC10 bacterium]PWB46312.1 MAG: ribosomal-protein-alanine N-acetyltransferase [candidate division NC10 bacterium]
MRKEDLPDVLVIESLSFAEPWTDEMFVHELDSERFAASLVARADQGTGERIVGFLCAWIFSGELHINNLAVHPRYRGRGVASQLMDAILTCAYAKHVTVGYLEVRASNEAAAALYQSYGFQPIGRRRNYYEHPREDAIVMRRQPF